MEALKKHWIIISLLAIVALGAGLRLYALGENSFVADEFLDINGSYGYAQTGQWQAWDFNYGVPATQNINVGRDERAFAYKWQVAQVLRFLPPTEANARLVSALWGIVSLLLMFLAGWFYSGRKEVGLLAAFLFAVSVAALEYDRRLRMYAMFLPVYLLFATALFATLERPYRGRLNVLGRVWDRYGVNIVFLPFAIALGILSYHVHQLTIAIVPVFGLYVAVQAWLAYRQGHGVTRYSVLVAAGSAAALLGLALGYGKLLDQFFYFFDDHYSYLGYLLRDFAHPLLGVLLVGAGLWTLAKKLGRDKEAWWLGLSLLVPVLMAIFLWRRNAGPQYIYFVHSFSLLLAALGIWGLVAFVRDELGSKYRRLACATLTLLLLVTPAYGYFLEENNTYHQTSTSSNPNYRKVFGYFMKQHEPGDALITRNFRNYYWSGAKVPVYDFGGELSEKNFSLAELEAIRAKHASGWVIISGNDRDYISGETEQAIEATMERVSNSQVRGDISVYRWGARQ